LGAAKLARVARTKPEYDPASVSAWASPAQAGKLNRKRLLVRPRLGRSLLVLLPHKVIELGNARFFSARQRSHLGVSMTVAPSRR
jgi:hypothetical protein